jgi:AcrR family transcriptional regulator
LNVLKASPKPTLRERSKLDKRNRIERAAREVFAEHGFDKATTREIARHAEVGVATLFVYAPDKAQLLRWIFASELDRISVREIAARPNEPLASQLIQFLKPRYEVFARDPRLSRAAMRFAYATYVEYGNAAIDPPESAVWTTLHQRIREIIEWNQHDGRVRTGIEVAGLATIIYSSIYMTQVHTWMSGRNPSVDEGLETLMSLYQIICEPLNRQSAN